MNQQASVKFLLRFLYTLPLFAVILASASYAAYSYNIVTFAGVGPGSIDATGGAARFHAPTAVAADSGGNLYVADQFNHTIRKITSTGEVSTLAGSPESAGLVNAAGSNARFDTPSGVVVDGLYLYVADSGNHVIRQIVIATGEVTTVATSDPLLNPVALAVDASYLYVVDSDASVIYRILKSSGVMTPLAGPGEGLIFPQGLAVDGAQIYFADAGRNAIYTMPLSGGTPTLLAGSVTGDSGSDDGIDNSNGIDASFNSPTGIALDGSGNLYVADVFNNTIRMVAPDGDVTTIAGTAGVDGSTDGIGNAASFSGPTSVAVNSDGDVVVTDSFNNTIRVISHLNAAVTTFAGTASAGSADGTGATAHFSAPAGVAVDANGNIYVGDTANNTIRKITPDGTVTTIAGVAGQTGLADSFDEFSNPTTPLFHGPAGVAVDSAGNVYVADTNNAAVRKIASAGVVTTIAVDPNIDPQGIAVDGSGNLYVADTVGNTIQRITPGGGFLTFAGVSGEPGSANGDAATARFKGPTGVAVDAVDNVYVADQRNNTIRKISPLGDVETIAGSASDPADTVDGTGLDARFNRPTGIAVDTDGNLFVCENFGNTIRKLTPTVDGYVVTTEAGLPRVSGSLDGLGSVARFTGPTGIAVTGTGVLYIADKGNNVIRRGINPLATVALSDLNPTYDGSPKSATVTTNPAGLTVAVTYNGSATVPTNAGTYAVEATVTDPNYTGSATGSLVIAKAAATVTLGSLSATYDGAPKAATATTNPSGKTVVFTYDGSPTPPTNAGSYAVVGTIDDANYAGNDSATLTISPAGQTITFTGPSDQVFGVSPITLSATASSGLPVSFSVVSGPALVTDNTLTITGAGSVTIRASQSGNLPNVSAAPNVDRTFAVAKAAATVTLGNLSATYDGSPVSATASTTPGGLTVLITYDGSPAAPANAGTYAVVGTIDDANYEGSSSNNLVISKATASVTLGNLSATYDGSPKAATATPVPSSLAVTFTYDGSPTAPTNAGTYAVIGTVNDANYQGSASSNLVIAKATATVTLGSLSATYDGSPKAATATTVPSSLAVTFTYDGSATVPTSAGTYAVVGTIDDTNYQGSASNNLVIAKATASVTLGNLSVTYDGSPKAATATTTPSSLAVTFTYDGSATAPANAGTYAVVGTINDTNYQGSASSNLVIAKATATVTLGNLAATYDASPKSATATTNPSGKTVTFTYNGSATAPTNAGTYAVVGTINDSNYQGSASDNLVIGKATASVTLGNLSATYDGSPKSATATTNPVGLAVNINYDGGSPTAPSSAGNHAVVATINEQNYTGTASDTLVINKATPDITWTTPAAITYGTALSATQLNATANVPGTFVYSPAAGATPNAGTQTLDVTFTPTDTANYENKTAQQTLTVNKAAATVTLGSLAAVWDGTAKAVTATTTPTNLTVSITYGGSNTAPTNPGSYAVEATIDETNYSGTASGTLVISDPGPLITAQSAARNVIAPGDNLDLSVTAIGTGTVTYQWTHNGRNVAGGTTNTLSLSDAITQDSGYYLVTVANEVGSITSHAYFVTVAPVATQVLGWGRNAESQVTPPADLTDAVQIAMGDYHGLAVRRDGTVVGWGLYNFGASVVPAGLSDVVAIAAGEYHSLALKSDGTVVAWGKNDFGEAVVPAEVTDVVAIVADDFVSGAVKRDGTVVVWGNSQFGQPTVPAGLSSVGSLALGVGHCVALRGDGSVVAWGLNLQGETVMPAGTSSIVGVAALRGLSLGWQSDGSVVSLASGSSSVFSAGTFATILGVACGDDHALGLKADGTVVGYGINTDGQTTIPAGLNQVFAVAASYHSSLALRDVSGDVAPAITTQPVSQTIAVPQNVTFSVSATGTLLQYTWYKEGTTDPFGYGPSLSLFQNDVSRAGNYYVVVSNSQGSVTSANATLTVNKGTPVITWNSPAPITYGTALGSTQLNASASPAPGGFTYNPSLGTVLGAGDHTITATFTPSDPTNYNSASAQRTITVNPAVATVTLGSLNANYDGTAKAVSATTTPSGLTVAFTYNGSPTAPTNAGTYAVVGTISDPNYAGSAGGTLTIQPQLVQSLHIGNTTVTYDGTPKPLEAFTNVPANIPLTVTYDGSTTAPTNAGTYVFGVSSADPNYQASAAGQYVIAKATATVTLGSLAATYNGAPHAATAATNPIGKIVTLTYDGSATVPTNAGSYAVAATVNDANYQGSTTGTLVIAKAAPTLTWPAPAAIASDVPLSGTQLNATANVAGTFTYNPALGTLLTGGTHTLSATFTPTDGVNYAGGSIQRTLVVNNANGAPIFIQQPIGTTVVVGQPATFAALASGTPAPTYQWKKGGVNIPGATNATYTIPSVVLGDAGSYTVVATNVAGAVTSDAAVLNVINRAVPGDIDGDGKADLIWQNRITGERSFWLMNGTAFGSGVAFWTVDPAWQIVGTGDFNVDGKNDLVWTNTVTGERSIWLMNGTSFSSGISLGTVPLEWEIVAIADFNADGIADLVWQNSHTGECSFWLMNGDGTFGGVALTVQPTNRRIVAGGDFNSDGKPDLVWTDTTTGERIVWLMNGTNFVSEASLGSEPKVWQIVGSADYDGDGKSDLVWTNTSTGERTIWLMNDTTHTSTVTIGTVTVDWMLGRTQAVPAPVQSDFTGDANSDVIWQNLVTGERTIWVMNGTSFSSGVALGTIPGDWQIVASGDFNADGKSDIVWANTTTGERSFWLMNGTTFNYGISMGTVPTNWQIVASGDFNADGKSDLVWSNATTGERSIWLMNGTSYAAGVALSTVPTNWQIVATGDFNADGKSDLVWTDTATGERALWLMDGTSFNAGVSLGIVPTNWQIVGTGDFNADGKSDLVLTDTSTGERVIWLMNGTTHASTVSLGFVPTQWHIRN